MIPLDSSLIDPKAKQKTVAISGNAALARGIIESSARVVTSYPGTPCAEIIENLEPLAPACDLYLEWSINEKVAFEIAMATAIAGRRSVFITKHVGMNWIMDPLMAMAYGGITAGMVIISADDPGAPNSPIEQDTRPYAKMACILGLEPSDQQEAKDMVIFALEKSEKTKLPVLLRTTNRILYGRGIVCLGEINKNSPDKAFHKNPGRWIIAGKNAVHRHEWLCSKQHELKNISEQNPFNKLEGLGSKKLGIIASGVSYLFVKELLKDESVSNEITVLKIGSFQPLPEDLIKKIASEVDELLILEELEPFIEEETIRICASLHKKINIAGKINGACPRTGAYTPDLIADIVKGRLINKKSAAPSHLPRFVNDLKDLLTGSDAIWRNLVKMNQETTFCPGCPHRASLYCLTKAIKEDTLECVITADIGCSTLSIFPPFYLGDFVFSMGAGLGIACGLQHAQISQKRIAIIGDSSFLHAGIPALINCCNTDADILIYLLDNGTIAMTGMQPCPSVVLEDIVKACGVEYLKIVDPYRIGETQETLREALSQKGQRVIISRRPCAQLLSKEQELKNIPHKTYSIDQARCKNDKICIQTFGCPAFCIKGSNVVIDKTLCCGCGICLQICPYHAITHS